jgi:serine/threonine protein kinase
MSPEQLIDAPNVDERTDIYAAGVMMYEALTGCLPFRADGYNALVLAIAAQRPLPMAALVPDVPRALERVVMRAMAKEPRDRHPDAQTLIDELETLRCAVPATGGRREAPASSRVLHWALAMCLGLPLSVSIWFAGHPPQRAKQATPTTTSVAPAQQVRATPEQRREQNARASGIDDIGPASASSSSESVARAAERSAPRTVLPMRTAGMVQARQARAPARSRAGNIRWTDL